MSESKFSYVKEKAKLSEILANLEREDLDIDEAVQLYKKGQIIISNLEKYLSYAENKVKKLRPKPKSRSK